MCSGDDLTPLSQEVFGFDSPPLHDSTAVTYVIDPSLFQVGPMAPSCSSHTEHMDEIAAGCNSANPERVT